MQSQNKPRSGLLLKKLTLPNLSENKSPNIDLVESFRLIEELGLLQNKHFVLLDGFEKAVKDCESIKKKIEDRVTEKQDDKSKKV